MNSLKDHIRKAHPTINYFLTYADNYAVGYFKKQGFTKEISYPREKWVGYIKDYEGGTIMQCKMLPKVKYSEVHQMLADQKAVCPLIRLCGCHQANSDMADTPGGPCQDQEQDARSYRLPWSGSVQGQETGPRDTFTKARCAWTQRDGLGSSCGCLVSS